MIEGEVNALQQVSMGEALNKMPMADICRALMAEGKLHETLTLLSMKLKDNPEDRETLLLASDCYWEMRQTDKALKILEILLERDIQDIAVLARLGGRLMAMGNREGAEQALDAAIGLDPANTTLIASMDLVRPLEPEGEHARILREAAEAPKTGPADREAALNTLGRLAQREGKYSEAIDLFMASKACVPVAYDSALLTRKVDHQISAFSARNLKPAPTDANGMRPVFITGVPRSGTTLLEAMASRHPDIASVGESQALARSWSEVRKDLNPPNEDWTLRQDLSQPLRDKGRTLFLTEIGQILPHAKPLVIDKMPSNIFNAGFAAMAMPEAKFIYMQRHPLDLAVSLLANNFAGSLLAFTKKQEWIAHYIRQSEASARHFDQTLGCRFRMQSYRALVQDTENQMREILGFLEIAWDDKVLQPEQSILSFRTASVLQVREGVNRKGLEKWRPYAETLQPLIDAIGGWPWIAEWEAQYESPA